MTPTKPPTLRIRLANPADLPEITVIYNHAVRAGGQTAETTEVNLAERQHWLAKHAPDRRPVYVAEMQGQVAGYLTLSDYRPGRQAVARTAEVSYYVAPAFFRQGVASALLNYALQAMPALDISTVFAIVIASNQASLALLQKHGFEIWGRLPGVVEVKGQRYDHLYLGREAASD